MAACGDVRFPVPAPPSLASPPDPASPAAIRAAITLLSLAAFFSGAALRICDGLLPRLASDFGVTPGTAGRVVLTFSIAYGVAQLGYGPLGDRYGKARLVCAALFASAVGAAACAFASGFDALVAVRVLWGLSAAGVIPLGMAWVGDTVPYEQRQATLARLLIGTLSGMMAGQLAGGLFADSPWGWRGAFGSLAVGYVAVGGLLLARLRHIPSAPPVRTIGRFGFARQLAAVVAIPWARVVLAAALAEGIFLIGPMAFLPAYLHQRFGLSLSSASALVALYAVGGLVYAMTARHIVRRLGEARMVWAGGLGMGAGFIGLLFMPMAWLAGPLALALGFATYLYHNTLQTNATQMAPAARGSAMAVFASCLFTGQAIGVTIAGFAFDHGGPLALLLIPAVAMPLAGAGFAIALGRRVAA
ncbi:MAG: putative rane transport protein [Ramlibacter sp.]|jgi:predicted MFS family arabinose efflux permease|nr:putative rane transport protein [Ramlibacter sp.]